MRHPKSLAFLYPVLLFASLLVPYKLDAGFIYLTANRLIILAFFVFSLISVLRQGAAAWFISLHQSARFFIFTMAFWLVYGTLTLLWVKNKPDALRELMHLGFAFLIVLTCLVLYSRKDALKQLFRALQGITGTMILIMLGEILSGYHLPLSRFAASNNNLGPARIYTPTGISYNENDQAFLMLLLLMIPLAKLLLLLKNRKVKGTGWPRQAILPVLTLLLTLYVILAARSFIIVISLALTLLFALVIVFAGEKLQPVRPSKTLPVILLTGAAIFMVFLSRYGQLGVRSFYAVPSSGQEILNKLFFSESSLITRIHLIIEGLRQFIGSYGLGVGANGFKDNIADLAYTFNIVNPHCWLVEILAQYGMIVLGFYVTSLILLGTAIYKSRMHLNSSAALSMLILLIAFIPGSFVPSQLLLYWPQWLLIGIAFATGNTLLPGRPHPEPYENR